MSGKRCMGCMNEQKTQYTVCPYCGLKAETAPDPSQIRPGTVLAQRYEVGFALKIGLYTITYIAYDLQREEKVIVKEYYPSQLCSRVDGGNRIGIRAGGEQKTFYERGLTQFLKEAKDLHSVSVPFLIPVQDVFTENATAYMVMPYLNGKTLEAAIAEKKRFSITETLALMMPVMDITDRLHQKGILHLNIHPGNIFLVDSGEVILMDSGRYSRSFVDAPMETIGENSRYQAPEIRNLHEKIDGSVDVYSICTIMYEMITGTEIEDGASRITKDTVKSPLSRRVKVTANQDTILMNGLALHSKDRINSVEKLMKSFVSIRPVQKVEEPAAVQKKKAPERRKTEGARHEKKAESSSGSGGMLRIILPCVLVLCIAVGGFIAFGHFKGKNTANMTQKKKVTANTEKTAPVPNVSNQTTYEKAKKAAQDAGFKLKRTDAEKVQEGEKTDIVTKQDPKPGTVAEIGSTIRVTVTASNITLDNDDVLGPDVKILNYELSKDDKNILNNVFNIYSSEIESNIIPGYLLRICKGSSDDQKYSLNMNSEILKYSQITLVYSAGRKDITEGQDAGIVAKELLQNNIQNALDEAKKKGFYVGISQTADYTTKNVASLGDAYMIKKLKDDGKEVEMGDDDEIKTGDKILLCLSRGPKRIKINGKYLTENTYLGSEYKSAKEALEKAGVTVTQTNSYSSSVPAGKIISTSHTCRYKDKENEIEESQQGGIHEGDSVAVTVSDGPAPTTQAPRPTQPASGGGSSGGSRKSSSPSNDLEKKSNSPGTTKKPPKGPGY
ncbi:MAG: PASTA domain-containing protein [Anaerobutyricum hallii]|uniref:protein kinase domain-containing protein n=1 Tax=Anaerobutyricum hallii TaxID=39488 RepID=UPI002E7A9D2C|nr:PASTA domain-containing protein [Anaerobutyricum hallii]MEE1483892.1 PASTA domain-containing protein [Anaerobutyricum hallii]